MEFILYFHWDFPQQQKIFVCASALLTEATACGLALKWAKNAGLNHLILLTDSTSLVHALNQSTNIHVSIKWTISHIREIAKDLAWCQLIKVPRTQVHDAHTIARWCRINQQSTSETL